MTIVFVELLVDNLTTVSKKGVDVEKATAVSKVVEAVDSAVFTKKVEKPV